MEEIPILLLVAGVASVDARRRKGKDFGWMVMSCTAVEQSVIRRVERSVITRVRKEGGYYVYGRGAVHR